MKKSLLIVLVVALAAAGGWFYLRLSRPAPAGATLLPANTYLFVQIPEFAAARADFENSSLGAALREPDVRAFLDQPLTAWRTALNPTGRLTDELLAQVLDTLDGEAFFAMTRLALIGEFRAGLVFGADVGRGALKAKLGLNRLEARHAESSPSRPLEKKRYLGVDYTLWPRGNGSPICYTFLNSLFVAALGEDTLRDVIARHTGQLEFPTPALAENPVFQQVGATLPARHALLGFVNMEPVVGLLAPLLLMMPDAADALRAFASLRGTALSVTFDNGKLQEVRATLYHPAGHRPDAACSDATLAFTTPDTLWHRVGATDFAAGYDNLRQVIAQLDQPEIAAAINSIERHLLRTKIDPRADVLAQLGPETGITLNWRAGAEFPELALVTAWHGAAAGLPALDEFMNAVKLATTGPDTPWDESTAAEERLRTLPLGASKIAPTYFTTGSFLVIASSADFARELLAARQHNQPTLATTDRYRAARQRLPNGGSAYTWIDLPNLYPRLEGIARTLNGREATIPVLDLASLPAPATLAPHLAPLSSATVSTPEQVTTVTHSSFGSPLAIALWVATGQLAGSGLNLGELPLSLPGLTTKSSSTPSRAAPTENQPAGSQTPPSPPAAPTP